MKYLSLDWGLKKFGTAYSDGSLATPGEEIGISSLEDGVKKVLDLVRKNSIETVVIGQPEGEMGRVVLKTITAFKKAGLNIIGVDETLTSQDALKTMIDLGYGKKMRQGDHKVAAAIILQRFLDEA
ncbi:MAG: RuvX/YqgF family protein [Candidatus Daviesbacteria bacterium]|nr:RuvX/YqgF family protein [Candidatus Daviesbacteria bacterium]